MSAQLTELSLFTGGGGGVWASKMLNHKVIGYVEWNDYAQQVIAARIADGSFDKAPIFTDVREFVQSGAARQYRGFADVVSGGFPCQSFSTAGRGEGGDGEQNMWPATRDVIRDVRPRVAFLENVANLLTFEYFGTILADLAQLGYVGRWGCISGQDVGAVHCRRRAWIYAHDPKQDRAQGDKQKKVYRFTGFPWGANVRGVKDVRNRSSIPEPLIRRISDGISNGRFITECAGNAQIPLQAATAFKVLSEASS